MCDLFGVVGRITRSVLPLLVVVASAASISAAPAAGPSGTPDDPALKDKKIISFGGGGAGGVSTDYFKENVELVEKKLPIDGILLGVHPTIDGTFTYFSSRFFGDGTFNIEDFKPFIADMKATKTGRFTDNFLQLNVMPGDFDWFDDNVIQAILSKAVIAATITRDGGLKGIFLDTEQYALSSKGIAPFNYENQKDKESKSMADYQKRVEEVGYRLARTFAETHPGMTLIFTYGNGLIARSLGADGKYPLSASNFDLFPAFLDGMLRVDGIRLFDGYESSYLYKTNEQFRQARRDIKETGKRYSRYPDLYEKRLKVAFAVWPVGGAELKADNYLENYFTPEELEHALNFAMRNSDGYIWLYLGGMSMLRNKYRELEFPPAYKQAIINARKPHSTDYKPVYRQGDPLQSNPPGSLVFEVEDMGIKFTPASGAGEAVVRDSTIGLESKGQHGKMIELVGGASKSTGTARFTFPKAIPDGIYSLRVRIRYPRDRHDTTIQWIDSAAGNKVKPLEGSGTGWTRIVFGNKEKGTWLEDGKWTWLELYGPSQPFKENNYGWKEFKGVGPGDYSIEINDDDARQYRLVYVDQFELVKKPD